MYITLCALTSQDIYITPRLTGREYPGHKARRCTNLVHTITTNKINNNSKSMTKSQ